MYDYFSLKKKFRIEFLKNSNSYSIIERIDGQIYVYLQKLI
jgi:hypothetical protein